MERIDRKCDQPGIGHERTQRFPLSMSCDGANLFIRNPSLKIMVTTRSQSAPSHYFVPVSNHRMDGKAMDDTASSATQESADSAAQHVMAVRNAAILLEKTKISADQILFKLHNSTTEYAPTRRAYEALQRVTQNFSICVEYISSALLRFNIPDSRLPAVVDDLLIGADEVYKALNAAADGFFSTSIAGQDDC
ncbi:MAG: hypothetical protein RR311_15310, partial [Comamonas sp.]